MSVVPSNSHRSTLEEALQTFEANLLEARAYLEGRAFTGETARAFRLGVVPPDSTDWYPGRLVIPYLTPKGVADLKFRSMELDPEAKYIYKSGTEQRLFNAGALLHRSPTYVITEGEFDAMAVWQATGLPAIGYPGAQAWKPFWSRAFYGCPEVVVLADGDKAGRDAAKEVAKQVGRTADSVRIVELDDGMDANSVLVNDGPEALREVIG